MSFNSNTANFNFKIKIPIKTIGNNPIDFYSIIENNKYMIDDLSGFSEDKTVRLGYKSNVYPRTLSIGINNI